MYVSKELNNAYTQERCVEIINEGTCEGMEGIEFNSDQLAGQYAAYAAIEAGYTDQQSIDGQLDVIANAGAEFDSIEAMKFAIAIVEAEKSTETEPETP